MRHSEFWQAMDAVFGRAYAKSLAADLVLGALGGRTAAEALDAGAEPRDVWNALCDAKDVSEAERWAHLDVKRSRRRR
jgi:hypothetical protein